MDIKTKRRFYPSLVLDYQEGKDEIREFYDTHFTDIKGYQEKHSWLEDNFPAQNREVLAGSLQEFNQSLGACGETMKNIGLLEEKDTAAVVTGQQAGVLTGPLYTIYKAAAAVKLAQKLSREGMKSVPVFWIASEDHDFQEVRSIMVQGQDGSPQKIEMEGSSSGHSMEKVFFSKGEVESLIEQLEKETPAAEFKEEIMQAIRDTALEGESLTRWFALLMTRLFQGTGLIMFNPLQPEIRKLAPGLLSNICLQEEKINDILSLREDKLREKGYHLQVEWEEGHLNLFAFLEGGRAALFNQKGHVITRQGEQLGRLEDVAETMKQSPGQFGPGVLTRPLLQEVFLPTLSYVAGPGELSYFPQLMPLYNHFNLKSPVLYPRPSLTLVEPRMRRYLDKYSLSASDLFRLGEAREELLEKRGKGDLEEAFKKLETVINKEYASLADQLSEIEKGLVDLSQKNLGRVLKEVGYLRKKAEESLKNKHETAVNHFRILEHSVLPQGDLQERKYNIFFYLIKYGPAFWDKLLKDFPLEPGHHFINIY